MHVGRYRRMKDRFTVVAVCDPDGGKVRAAVAERIGVEVLTFDEAVARDDIDIVDICTPPAPPPRAVPRRAAAGKHVVCEKPLVGSLADVDELTEVGGDGPSRLMPVFQYRFGNGLQQVKALVDAGLAGRGYTSTVEVAWRRRADYYDVPVAGSMGHRARRGAAEPGGARA